MRWKSYSLGALLAALLTASGAASAQETVHKVIPGAFDVIVATRV